MNAWLHRLAMAVGQWLVVWASYPLDVESILDAEFARQKAQDAQTVATARLIADLHADVQATVERVGASLRAELRQLVAVVGETHDAEKQSAFQRMVAALRPKALPTTPAALGACPICGAPWVEHRCPYTPSTTASDRLCEVCGVPLPVAAVRTHDGHWLCHEHKGA